MTSVSFRGWKLRGWMHTTRTWGRGGEGEEGESGKSGETIRIHSGFGEGQGKKILAMESKCNKERGTARKHGADGRGLEGWGWKGEG
jgi:hypothetical protein